MSATRTALTRPAARSGARGAGRPGLRALPQVNAVMEREDVRRAADRHGRRLIAALLRERLASLRGDIRSGRLDGETLGRAVADLPDWIEQAARVRTSSSIRPVSLPMRSTSPKRENAAPWRASSTRTGTFCTGNR